MKNPEAKRVLRDINILVVFIRVMKQVHHEFDQLRKFKNNMARK